MPPHKFGAPFKADAVVGNKERREFLPSRFALAKLTKGDPFQRSIGMYAKRSPIGAGAPATYASIEEMGKKGVDLKKK